MNQTYTFKVSEQCFAGQVIYEIRPGQVSRLSRLQGTVGGPSSILVGDHVKRTVL